MDVGVALALRFVNAVAASEDYVGPVQQKIFVFDKLWWRKTEIRKFVHAVVHDGRSVNVYSDRIQHRCIKPQNRLCPAGVNLQQLVKQSGCCFSHSLAAKALRYPWAYHHNTRLIGVVKFKERCMMIRRNMLFEEEYRTVFRKSHHQMLRTLNHKVPAKVGKAD